MSNMKRTEQPPSITKIWKAALYIRLSREDGESGESYSVKSQREILTDYVERQEDIELFDIYIDDGWSGTNFERPAFQKMMNDIYEGKLDCVIVKDLSRFGRNYTDSGNYIDNIFVRLNIRFIALNNGFDSFAGNMNSATKCVTLGVTNVINESLAATTSVNIRSTLNSSRRKGEFIGSFACYGYKKDENNRHRLVIDEEAAEVVRMIYSMFIGGKSILSITRELNNLGIPNPTTYKVKKGYNYRHKNATNNSGYWCDQTVRRILKNEMYIGNMVQGRNTNISYKIKKCVSVPKEQWIVVQGTHEPIIDKETFAKAQRIFGMTTKISVQTHEVDKFAGLIKCAECGRAMGKKTNRQPYGTYVYYRCVTPQKVNKSTCSNHSIRYEKIEQAVSTTIDSLIDMALDVEKFIDEVEKRTKVNQKSSLYDRTHKQYESDLERLKKHSLNLYPDWKDGMISQEEYLTLKENINVQIADVEQKLKELDEKESESKIRNMKKNEFLNHFIQYAQISNFTRPILIELIDSILVHEDGSITINFKFQDAFEEALEYIEEVKRKMAEELGGSCTIDIA